MRLRHPLWLVLGLLLGLVLANGCSLDRAGRFTPDSDSGQGLDDAGAVDATGADTGTGCTPTSPSTEICDGVDNDCDRATADGADDPRLLDPCDDLDPDLCVDDVTLCVAGVIVCRPGPTDAVEVCNGLDDDCDDVIDEDAVDAIGFSVDADGDGHGDPAGIITMACEAPSGQANPRDDCDDTNGDIYPGAPEVCNAIDDDCDGMRDEEGCPCDVLENGGHVYLFCAAANWTSARDTCTDNGYQLVTIDGEAENSFVRSEASARGAGDVWIGYNDRGSNGSFVWQGPDSSYRNWSGGEPNNGGCPLDIGCHEDCVELFSDGRWNDQACDDSRFFVCEAP
ncbi:MAG: hypothetical protein GXP55_26110 [Deltaproteobacteria bacterium]|nr:hypothetical protein [Deltaproteobacteria bacterium]